jgi:phosphoglycolate phosphatase
MRRLLLFDIDGTLLRTEGAGRRATRAALLDVFGTAGAIDTHHFGGKTDYFTLIELLRDAGHDEASIGPKIPQFIQAMGQHMAVMIRQYPAYALPGALAAISHLRQHQPDSLLGIVTGNAPTSARVKLQAAGYDPDWFMIGAYGTESSNRDDLPRLALERAQTHSGTRYAPDAVTVIGDTALDIQAARANGFRVIAVKTGFEDPDVLQAAEPDILLDDLTTLLEVL